jgi:glycosyltransferase involved in cell wall biosynthesis
MRVLQVIADGSPGGGTTHVLQILTGLRRQHSFGLITQDKSYLLREGRNLGISSFGIEFFRSRIDPRVPIRIRQIVGNFRPDVVHAHGGRAAFFCALGRLRPRMVYTVHAYHFVDKSPAFRSLAIASERWMSRRTAHTIFVCNYDRRLAEKYSLLRKEATRSVIPSGIALSQIPRAAPSSSRHIGFIGRLEHQKDPLLFLAVLERLPECTATLVGGGRLDDQVRAKIALCGLQARVLGPLSHDQALKILSTLGVLLMTSRWEGLPLLALEAMCAGVPIVATSVGGMPEIIEDGRSGMLVRTRSPDDIAAAVRKLTEDLPFRESIIRNARERVQRLFSEERMLREIQSVYEEVSRL